MSTQVVPPVAETSVTFSLQELMKIERERIVEQERDRAREASARREAEREAQRCAEQEQRARIAHEQEQRHAQEEHARAEAARLRALQNAIIERERNQTRQQAHLEEVELDQKHQLALEALRQESTKRALKRGLLLVSGGAMLLCGGVVLVQVGVLQPAANERYAAASRRNIELQNDIERLGRSVQTHSESVDRLITQLHESEQARAILTTRLAEAEHAHAAHVPSSPAPVVVRKPPLKSGDTCRGDDPMCPLNGKRLH